MVISYIKIKEIDDVTVPKAVGEVTNDSGDEEGNGDTVKFSWKVASAPENQDCNKRPNSDERENIIEARKQIEALREQKPDAPTAMAVSDYEHPENLRVHLRGSHLTLGQEIPRRFLQIQQK